ncbi:MAG: GAF domain-containing sensor histidine kinase [Bacteroidota bacterium]
MGKLSGTRRDKVGLTSTFQEQALTDLLEISNVISRLERVDDIFDTAADYLVKKSVFNFEFCNIYLIDKSLRKIDEVYSDKNEELFEWDFTFRTKGQEIKEETDILLYVLRENKPVKVIADAIYDVDHEDLAISDCKLDEEIYNKYQHHKLARLFIPLLHRSKQKVGIQEGDHTIGVIEVGGVRDRYRDIGQYVIGLKFFAHNCSLSYLKSHSNQEERQIGTLFAKASSEKHHEKFLKTLLKESIQLVEADYAEIISHTFSDFFIKINSEEVESLTIPKPIILNDEKEKEEVKKLFAQVGGKDKYIIFSKTFQNKADIYAKRKGYKSQVTIPIVYDDQITSLINYYSRREDFFGEKRANILFRLVQLSAPQYYQKKLKFVVEEKLVNPLPIFSRLEEQIKPVTRTIEKYFNAEYVSFWERDGLEPGTYKQAFGSPRLEKNCGSFGAKTNRIPTPPGISIKISHFDEAGSFADSFRGFANKHNLKSVVSGIIKIGNDEFGILNIYSHRKISSVLPEDETFILLVANKIARSIQSGRLYRSFVETSKSITTSNRTDVLQQIANTANGLLRADLVILHVYNSREKRFLKKMIVSGILKDKRVVGVSKSKDRESGEIVYWVMHGTKDHYWIQNDEDYQKEFEELQSKHPSPKKIFTENFWTRENIKSLAASKLMYEGELVGVMFFNYRTPRMFDEDTKSLIRVFSDQTATAIILNRYMAQQKEALDSFTGDIPGFTKAMLAEFSKPVSHEIKNHLGKIGQLMYRLESEVKSNTIKKKITPRIKDINDLSEALRSLLKLNEDTAIQSDLDINEVIRNCLKIYQTSDTRNIRFETEGLSESLPLIYCNKTELSMIFYNIISNAVRAIQQKDGKSGLITFISQLDGKGNYRIVISDNGIGIRDRILPRIFEHGFSTSLEGSGIGLFYVKKLLESEKFNGEVLIDSTYRKGTTAIIKIPYHINKNKPS